MSALDERTQAHLTTMHVNGCPVVAHQAHRGGGERYGPPLVTVTGAVALSLEEVTGLLFDWLGAGVTFAEVDDDATVRELVAESVLNRGCLYLDDARAMALRTNDAPTLVYCRQRALTVFGPRGEGVGEVAW